MSKYVKLNPGQRKDRKPPMIGKVFNRLTVLSEDGVREWGCGQRQTKYLCQCICGKTTSVIGASLRSGDTKSCGCLKEERFAKGNTTHGLIDSPIYSIWSGIKRRCLNSGEQCYSYYGGRGIKVCDRWADSFENFHADMISNYSRGLTIDRIDVNGDYCPENCKWSTRAGQAKNRRSSKMLEFNGVIKTQADWGRSLGGSKNTIAHRLRSGWSLSDALTIPSKSIGNSNRYCTK